MQTVVVVFDEAQLLPIEFLHPILGTSTTDDTLSNQFGVCTATQPSFEKSSKFPSFPGFEKGLVREIIQGFPSLFHNMKRVNIELCDPNTPTSWEELAARLVTYDKVLCIVSDRKSCRELPCIDALRNNTSIGSHVSST
jgi:CRISPR-associated endonuclease/helicase Cas3